MILLDTHVWLWLRLGSGKLGSKAKNLIDQALAADSLYISAISFWEISMLIRKNRLEITDNLDAWLKRSLDQGLQDIVITSQISLRAGGLQDLPGDPADRIILATALDGYRLMTADQDLLAWPGKLSRIDART